MRRCLLDAVVQAQGKGCGPGILGVCIGGDRGSGYIAAKEELFRLLTDENEDPRLRKLEKRVMKEANSLGIGPMGFGGLTSSWASRSPTATGCPPRSTSRWPTCAGPSAATASS